MNHFSSLRLQSRSLLVHHHLGLGDHLDCNGMIRNYAESPQWDMVYVFAKRNHIDMIKYMYRDNQKIDVIPIDPDPAREFGEVDKVVKNNPYASVIINGHEYYNASLEESNNKNCWEQFYELAHLDKSVRWEGFYYEKDPENEKRVLDKLNPTGEEYIFVHDDPSRGFYVDNEKIKNKLKVIKNDPTENIFHFTDVILNAKEVHCMESSFKSLVELLKPKAKLFFHDFRGHPLGDNTANWTIVDYK